MIKKIADGSGCTTVVSKSMEEELETGSEILGFRSTEMFGVTMLDLFTSKEREMIASIVRTNGYVVLLEDN